MTCALGSKYVAETIERFFERCRLARAAGGIALESVVDGKTKVPDGWWFDWQTEYYLPPNFAFIKVTL